MATIIKARLVKIGNSQGIRIPQGVLDELHLTLNQEVELEAQENQLILRPLAQTARQGWEEQFRMMAERGDDKLLDGEDLPPTEWEESEWVW